MKWLALLGLLIADAAWAREVSVDGRLAIRGLYSSDDAGNDAVSMVFLDTDARAADLTDGGLKLVLDATFVLDQSDLEERRFGRTERVDQVRQLNLVQPGLFGVLDVGAGRRILREAGNAWFDGVDLTLRLGATALGVYGGLAPDPVDYALDPDRQATGVFGTYQAEGFDAALAYNVILREGETDRQFVFNRLHVRVAEGLYLASYLVVDLAIEPEVTTLLTSVDYSPLADLTLTVNFSRYAIEQYRFQQIYRNVIEPNQALVLGDEVADLVYNRVRGSVNWRFGGHYVHFQELEYKKRSQDNLEAYRYTVGVRDDDLLGWGTSVDLRAVLSNNFQSDSYLLALTADQDFGATTSLSTRLTYYSGRTITPESQRSRAFDEAQSIVLAGVTGTWRPTAAHQLMIDYDVVYESAIEDARSDLDSLVVQTFMGRYAYLF